MLHRLYPHVFLCCSFSRGFFLIVVNVCISHLPTIMFLHVLGQNLIQEGGVGSWDCSNWGLAQRVTAPCTKSLVFASVGQYSLFYLCIFYIFHPLKLGDPPPCLLDCTVLTLFTWFLSAYVLNLGHLSSISFMLHGLK